LSPVVGIRLFLSSISNTVVNTPLVLSTLSTVLKPERLLSIEFGDIYLDALILLTREFAGGSSNSANLPAYTTSTLYHILSLSNFSLPLSASVLPNQIVPLALFYTFKISGITGL